MVFPLKSGELKKSKFSNPNHLTYGKQEDVYQREFKEEAVQLAQKSGNTSETARNLGLHQSVLRRWKKELKQAGKQAFQVNDTCHSS